MENKKRRLIICDYEEMKRVLLRLDISEKECFSVMACAIHPGFIEEVGLLSQDDLLSRQSPRACQQYHPALP